MILKNVFFLDILQHVVSCKPNNLCMYPAIFIVPRKDCTMTCHYFRRIELFHVFFGHCQMVHTHISTGEDISSSSRLQDLGVRQAAPKFNQKSQKKLEYPKSLEHVVPLLGRIPCLRFSEFLFLLTVIGKPSSRPANLVPRLGNGSRPDIPWGSS